MHDCYLTTLPHPVTMYGDPRVKRLSILIATMLLLSLARQGDASGSPILQSDDAATDSVTATVANPQSDSINGGPYPFYRPVTSGLLSLYQDFISPARGTSCPMHPHCSEYAAQVFGNYSPPQAYVMTADRLLRCGHDIDRYARVSYRGHPRFGDPATGSLDPGVLFKRLPRAVGWFAKSDNLTGSGSAIDSSHPQVAGEQILLFEFARSLQETHDYGRAITEYQRHLSYYPDSDYRPVVERNLLLCYYEAGKYRQAVGYGESVLGNVSHPESDEIRFYVGAAHFKRTDYAKAEFYFGGLGREVGPLRDKAQMAQGLTWAYELEWEKARQAFELIDDTSAYSIKALGCARLADEGANLKYKDPTLAGVAAIIPGLGYLYAGYPKTALSAFIVNALFIWGTYEAFNNDLPGLGATLAVFGIGWYTGNIYGSVTSATRRNMKMRHDHLIEFDIGYEF